MSSKENQRGPKRKKLEDWFPPVPHHNKPSASPGARLPLSDGGAQGGLGSPPTNATPAAANTSATSAQTSPQQSVAGGAAAAPSPLIASRSPRGMAGIFAVPRTSSIGAMVDIGVDEAWAHAALRRCGGADVRKAVEFCCDNDMDALAAEDAVEAASSALVAPQASKGGRKTSGGRAAGAGAGAGSGAVAGAASSLRVGTAASGAPSAGGASKAAPSSSAGSSATAAATHHPFPAQHKVRRSKKTATNGKGKAKGKIPNADASTRAAGAATTAVKAKPSASSATLAVAGRVDNDLEASVCGNLSVKLDKVDIAKNENRHYTMEVCSDTHRGIYLLRSRWGRQGYRGQTQQKEFLTKEEASAAFKKTFKDKTRCSWEDFERGTFKAKPGKYAVVETVDTGTANRTPAFFLGNRSSETQPCRLDSVTQRLVEMILSKDTMQSAMSEVEVDMRRLPLINLSESQVEKGYAPLGKIKDALQTPDSQDKALLLRELSNLFYKAIPHAIGQRARLPVINSNDLLLKKVKMLDVLRDISKAMCMLHDAAGGAQSALITSGGGSSASIPVLPHPTDMNYGALNARLELVDPGSQEYATIKRYFEETKAAPGGPEFLHLWSVDRRGEACTFATHDGLHNRKLLWHGTNVAVVAAIMKEGLRIMPQRVHGGRVGNGIYLASEAAKSIEYVTASEADGTSVGVLFLCEAALGKEASIILDDWRLTEPPEGYDSIVARGKQEPDPSLDTRISIDGKLVTVPQGRAIVMDEYEGSKFYNSEYLVYKESQQRIRFMLTVKF
ncbi:unnamed protein product [Scytosiphon promiscuus]